MSLRRIDKGDQRSARRALLCIYGYAHAIDEVTQAPLPALSRAEHSRLVPLGTSVRRNFGIAFRAVCRPAYVRAPVRLDMTRPVADQAAVNRLRAEMDRRRLGERSSLRRDDEMFGEESRHSPGLDRPSS